MNTTPFFPEGALIDTPGNQEAVSTPEHLEEARILGTIPYEILTSIPRRIERIVVR